MANIKIVKNTDSEYSKLLKKIKRPPELLYCLGDTALFNCVVFISEFKFSLIAMNKIIPTDMTAENRRSIKNRERYRDSSRLMKS